MYYILPDEYFWQCLEVAEKIWRTGDSVRVSAVETPLANWSSGAVSSWYKLDIWCSGGDKKLPGPGHKKDVGERHWIAASHTVTAQLSSEHTTDHLT